MAVLQLRVTKKHLAEIEQLGVRPVAISVDTPEMSRDLCRKAGYTYTFLSDPKAEVIRRYDLLHPGAGVNGQDIGRSAEFLLHSSGVIRWVNLTEDYRMRARPERIMEAAKALR